MPRRDFHPPADHLGGDIMLPTLEPYFAYRENHVHVRFACPFCGGEHTAAAPAVAGIPLPIDDDSSISGPSWCSAGHPLASAYAASLLSSFRTDALARRQEEVAAAARSRARFRCRTRVARVPENVAIADLFSHLCDLVAEVEDAARRPTPRTDFARHLMSLPLWATLVDAAKEVQ